MKRHPESSGLRRRITALLSLPVLLLVLSGCFRADMTYTIQSDGTFDLHAQGVALSPIVTREELDCQELASEDGAPIDGTITAEDYSEGSLIGCTISATGPLTEMTNDDGSYVVTQEGDVLTFDLHGDPTIETDEMALLGAPELTITVEFPGNVIDGGGGDVDGNRVTYTGIEWMRDGITATGSATAGFLAGLPGWAMWVAIGVGVALLALIIVLIVSRGKRKGAAAGQPAGYGGQQQWGGPQQQYAGQAGYGGQQQQWGGPQGQPQQQAGWDQGQQWGTGSPAQAGWDQGQQWGQGGQPQQGWGAQSPDQGQQGWDQGQSGPGQQGWDQGRPGPDQGQQGWNQGGQQGQGQQGQGWS